MELNDAQQRVVAEDGHCLVVACPGSGKTRVLTEKMSSLIERHGNRTRIIAVTFTRESARELEERAINTLTQPVYDRLCRIGTFHSLAIRLLRQQVRIGKIASPAQSYSYLRRAIQIVDPNIQYEDATSILEKAKTCLTSCEQQKHPLYLQYEEVLRNADLIDLYDILRDSVRYMRTGAIKPFGTNYLLVDEFQDTDEIQLEFIREHAKAGTKVTTVGDDDQSIYSFRGSMGYKGMQVFADFANATQITLPTNYRCRSEILTCADNLIRNNNERIAKELVAGRGPGGTVSSLRYGSPAAEAEGIIQAINKTAIRLEGNPAFNYTVPKDTWAVLSRGRWHLDEVELALQAASIQYYRPGGDSLWSKAPFAQLLALLRTIQTASPDGLDEALFHALSASMPPSDAQQTVNRIHKDLGDHFTEILDVPCLDRSRYSTLEMSNLSSLLDSLPNWRKQVAAGRLNLVISNVAAWFASFEKEDNKKSLVIRMGEIICKLRGTLFSRTEALLSTTKDSNKDKNETRGVILLTMHGSKGLEFNNVWIIRTEGTSIPSPKSTNLEEERRLMYVAITRAKNNLTVSSVMPDEPSIFIEEAGLMPNTQQFTPG